MGMGQEKWHGAEVYQANTPRHPENTHLNLTARTQWESCIYRAVGDEEKVGCKKEKKDWNNFRPSTQEAEEGRSL